jgi:hypothetical protein
MEYSECIFPRLLELKKALVNRSDYFEFRHVQLRGKKEKENVADGMRIRIEAECVCVPHSIIASRSVKNYKMGEKEIGNKQRGLAI